MGLVDVGVHADPTGACRPPLQTSSRSRRLASLTILRAHLDRAVTVRISSTAETSLSFCLGFALESDLDSAQGDGVIRYEPEDRPPGAVTVGVGLQMAIVTVPTVVLQVVIFTRIAEQPDSYVAWAATATLIVSGLATVLQAARVGRFGTGHLLVMGTSGMFIAVCIEALRLGGPSTMASLIVVSSLFQFVVAARLSWMRRVFSPIVAGTVIMLVAVTVVPALYTTMVRVPEGTASAGAPATALATLVTVTVLVLRGSPVWRLWSPIIAIAVGCAVAALFGIYDIEAVREAPWVGFAAGSWPGFDLTPSADFWALLPAFVVVTVVGAVETLGDGIAVQQFSRRAPRATDFRIVQGAINADGVGNLLSGLMGTLPNTTYSTSLSLAEVTGVAARRVGVVIGGAMVAMAFFPKITALLIAIPGPVAGAYVLVLIALLFVHGMRLVVAEGLNHRTAAVVGVSFWVGDGFQNKWIFPDFLGDGFAGVLFGNGMTAGAIVAVAMAGFMELTGARRRRLRVRLDTKSLQKVTEFLEAHAANARWNQPSIQRLTAAGEETLDILSQHGAKAPADTPRRLAVTSRINANSAVVEFATLIDGENLEDQLAYLNDLPTAPDDREVSFRLLRHYASTVHHRQYHGIDIVEITVHQTN